MTRVPGPDASEAALAALFAARRPPPLPAALIERILADARRVTAEREGGRVVAFRRRAAGPFGPAGGWRVAAGLAACAAFGFWLGLEGPEAGLGFDTAADPFLAEESIAFRMISPEDELSGLAPLAEF